MNRCGVIVASSVAAVWPMAGSAQEADAQATHNQPRITAREEEACGQNFTDANVITVCGRRDQTEEYRSPIPRPVDPQIRILPGFEPPPCENHLLSFCGRFGGGNSRPAEVVDFSRLPEALPDEVAERVTAAPETEPLPEPLPEPEPELSPATTSPAVPR
ncbi:exported hypothetical protein [Erythrobacter sp. EC-HK427]|nr:exported hypothetical protein [Erythrobacter sp. EC-HK427]